MKAFVVFLVFLTCTVGLVASGDDNGVVKSQSANILRQPNSGSVEDAETALQIGKVVLRSLLTPDDFQKKIFSEATLKGGIWTVSCSEPETRINLPVIIQIRQETGRIISYRDPNV